MRLSKMIFMVVIALLAIAILTVSTNAFSSADLANYITGIHVISGSQYKLSDAQAANVKAYLDSNPVTDAQAEQIKTLLEQAKSKVSGDVELSQMTDSEKTDIISLLQQAGNVAGLTVTVNTEANTITVSDGRTALLSGSYVNAGNGGLTVKFGGGDGSTATTGSAATASNGGAQTFVYTGANNTVFAVIALLAVVAVSTIVVKKVYAK